MPFIFRNNAIFIPFLLFISLITTAQEKIFFEPKAASGGLQSDFIEYKDIVIFENTRESRFDDFSQIIPTGNNYIVMDYSNKKILLFDIKGKYLQQVNFKERIGTVQYNKEQNRLEAISLNKMYELSSKDYAQIIEHFDNPKNWKYFRKYYLDLKDTARFIFHRQQINGMEMLRAEPFINGLKIISKVTVDKNFEKEEDYELKIFKGDSLVKKYFPYNKRNDSRYIYEDSGINVTRSVKPARKWVSRPYDYTVYQLTPDSLFKVYEFVLPLDRAMPFEFYKTEFKDKTEKNNYKRQNKKLISNITLTTNTNRYLKLMTRSLNYENKEYLFDTKTKTIYDNQKITPDSLTFLLPILNSYSYSNNENHFIRLTAKMALEMIASGKTKGIKYPDRLDEYLKNVDKDTNPVLILFEYKN